MSEGEQFIDVDKELTIELRVQMRIAVFNYFHSQLRAHATHILSVIVTILVILEIISRLVFIITSVFIIVVVLLACVIVLYLIGLPLRRLIRRWFEYARSTDIVTYADPVFKRNPLTYYGKPTSPGDPPNPEHYMTYILNGTKQRDLKNRLRKRKQ